MLFAARPPSDEELKRIYSSSYLSFGLDDPGAARSVLSMKRQTFDARARFIERFRKPGRVLDIGCASGAFLCSMVARGWQASGVELSIEAAAHAARVSGADVVAGTVENLEAPDGVFDIVHMADVIEHLRNPRAALRHVRRLLTPHGLLVLTTPDVGSLSARLLGRHWPNYKPEHLFFPNRQTIRWLLGSEGFAVRLIVPAAKALTLDFALGYFDVYGPRFALKLLSEVAPKLPFQLRRMPVMVSAGDMLVIAEPVPR